MPSSDPIIDPSFHYELDLFCMYFCLKVWGEISFLPFKCLKPLTRGRLFSLDHSCWSPWPFSTCEEGWKLVEKLLSILPPWSPNYWPITASRWYITLLLHRCCYNRPLQVSNKKWFAYTEHSKKWERVASITHLWSFTPHKLLAIEENGFSKTCSK